jgi:tetratricopeptide (TPR) repeat protein
MMADPEEDRTGLPADSQGPADTRLSQYFEPSGSRPPAPTDASAGPPTLPIVSDPAATNYVAPGDVQARTEPNVARPEPRLPDSGGDYLPRRFGDYELVEKVARGGMGVVYRARQLKAGGRSVALKVILARRFASAEAIARFRTEAELAAHLNHPGIVPIYEVGEIDGQPFYTMAFVPGGSLQRHVDGERLAPRQAARLLCQVAEAVHAAHEAGVIHRDLKPHNVLLRPNPQTARDAADEADTLLPVTPMLADFGLARAITPGKGNDLTVQGAVMGTPGYMPPEQAAGRWDQVDRRSDVYSLGAILYALLTGRPPFAADSTEETLRQVREEPPTPPRRLVPAVPRDLETVCLKCLNKEPGERYAGAGQLAEDLGLFLADRPLRHARRAGLLGSGVRRVVRAVRRRPWWAAYVAVSLLALLVLTTGLVGRLYERLHRFDHILAEAAELQERAEQARLQGRRSEALWFYDLAREKLAGLLADYPSSPHRLLVVERLADAHTRSGVLLIDLREWGPAEQELGAAQGLLGSQRDPPPECQVRLAEVYHTLGILHDARKDRAAALDYYDRALEIRRALCAAHPEDRVFQRDLARGYGYKGDTQLELGQLRAAWDSYEKARVLRQGLAADPADREARYQYARSLGNTGYYHSWCGGPEHLVLAVDAYCERLRYLEELAEGGEPPAGFLTDLPDCRTTLAELLLDSGGDADVVLSLLERARSAYAPLRAANPGDRGQQSEWVRIHVTLARHHVLKGDWKQASACLAEADANLSPLLDRSPVPPGDLYHRAVSHALHSQDPGLSAENRLEEEQDALYWLHRAVEHGFRNRARLERDLAFAHLHDRRRYQEAIERLRQPEMPE